MAATGFSPLINKATLMYAVILGIVTVLSQYSSILVYRHMKILDKGMIHSSLVLVLTFFIGASLYNENISWVAILRMVLALASTVLLVLSHNENKAEKERKRNTLKGYLLCGMMILTDITFTIVVKQFAMQNTPHDESSCFMLVNVFTFAFSVILCAALKKGNPIEILHELKAVGLKKYGYIALITVGSNTVSLSTAWIHAYENSVVLFVPMTAAINVVIQVLVAKVIGKEKIPKMAVALSLCSALLAFVG